MCFTVGLAVYFLGFVPCYSINTWEEVVLKHKIAQVQSLFPVAASQYLGPCVLDLHLDFPKKLN